MCQKAFGGPYGALVSVKLADLAWTRGEPKRFQSSNKVRRGFCEACGTPLTFEWHPRIVDLAICAFDDPAPIRPVVQMAVESAPPWTREVAALPMKGPAEEAEMQAYYASIVSYQHPDNDTENWSPKS
jgi:hypothetical protein